MTLKLLIPLLTGTVLMFAIMLLCRLWIKISLWKTAMFSILLTIAGLISTKIMVLIETGSISGQSFFGAMLFLPIILFGLSFLLKEKPGVILDLSAPSVCAMLAAMKVSCYFTGCCEGITLYTYYLQGETTIRAARFPSQLAELANSILILLVLLLIISNKKKDGFIFPLFMIIYGVTRFVLNSFRETTPFVFGLPAGHFWSIVSVVAGIVWLIIWNNKNKVNN